MSQAENNEENQRFIKQLCNNQDESIKNLKEEVKVLRGENQSLRNEIESLKAQLSQQQGANNERKDNNTTALKSENQPYSMFVSADILSRASSSSEDEEKREANAPVSAIDLLQNCQTCL